MSLSDWFRPRDDGRGADFNAPAVPVRIEPLDVVQAAPTGAGAAITAIIAAALAAIYVNEGGYANHPNDRGGATNFGITESVARRWGYRGDMRTFPKHCGPGAPVCADLIYMSDYIDKPGFRPMAAMSEAVLHELTDSGVLHGPRKSAEWFILSVNSVCRTRFAIAYPVKAEVMKAYQDCAVTFGPELLCRQTLGQMDGRQRAYFDAIVRRNPSQQVFYRGWIRGRIGNVPRNMCMKGL